MKSGEPLPGSHAEAAPGRETARAIATGIVAIAIFQFGLGLFASSLNTLFYAKFGPFYDSLSYLNDLISLQAAARNKGRIAALLNESFGTTVVYPWLVFAPFAKMVPAARANGVWIQIVAAASMQFMMFLYFVRTRSLPPLLALASSAVFCLIAAAFFFNGGLSDFRMDLLQYLLFAAVMAGYLIARRSTGLIWWGVLGCLTGLLFLGRATSPVYVAPIFAVLFVADIASGWSNWRRIVLRWAVASAVAAGLAGWYFVGNFEHLHYYYFVWNLDANARLPLAVSARHIDFVIQHVGRWLWIALAGVALVTTAATVAQHGLGALLRLNWRPLLFSAVPVGYLVLSGAGLNQFVSIVGCAGVIMFLIDPIEGQRPTLPPMLTLALTALLAIGAMKNVSGAIANHSSVDRVSSWVPRQEGLGRIVGTMADIARNGGDPRKRYTYAVAHTGSLSSALILNTLVYDHGFATDSNRAASRDGMIFSRPARMFGTGTAVEWVKIPGATDADKVAAVVSRFAEQVDILFVAAEGTELPEHVYISRFIPEIRRQISASDVWQQVGEPVSVSPVERILIFQNRRRMAASGG